MSHAFVKESDEQWLHEIVPTLSSLIVYLTRQNNGIRVYEKSQYTHPKSGKIVYAMSNGLHYSLDEEGRWSVV